MDVRLDNPGSTQFSFLPGARSQPIIKLLILREYEPNWTLRDRLACMIMRNSILEERSTFDRVWTRSSQQPVCLGMDRRFHMDHHERCYLLEGCNRQPRHLYSRPHLPANRKVNTLMQYFMHLRRPPIHPEDSCVVSITLTEDGYLNVLDSDTGEVLRSVYLSPTIKYRYLSWAEYLYSIDVKSVLNPLLPQGRPQGRHQSREVNSELLRYIIFDIHPLSLAACFKIDRQVFGSDIVDATVDGNLLITAHKSTQGTKMHKFYNLKQLIQETTTFLPNIGQSFEDKVIGRTPQGIPLTMDIRERPAVLLEVLSGGMVSFGGSPFLFLHNPNSKNESQYDLRQIENGNLVHTFSSTDSTLNSDLVEFHFDDYQRVLQVSGSVLSCYSIEMQKGGRWLNHLFSTDFKVLNKKEEVVRSSNSYCTRYGRVVKKKINSSSDINQCVIYEVDYENETNLVSVIVSHPMSEELSQTSMVFVNDLTGAILKVVPIPTWIDDSVNTVYYELSSIIHQTRNVHNSKYVCYVYSLNGNRKINIRTRSSSSVTSEL